MINIKKGQESENSKKNNKRGNALYKVSLKIIAGNGGNGCVSFRRERKVPKGGPDGGDGGRGGNVYVQGASGMSTLRDFRYKRIWKAESGKDGSSQQKTGASGEDLIIQVPVGTEVLLESEADFEPNREQNCEQICDVIEDKKLHLVARGGEGGQGNQHFATPSLQAPAIFTSGGKGEEKTITLLLKYMADIGLVGLPNAGKSTFVHLVSRAKVIIGDYAFSTLEPVLGVVPKKGIVVADLPGLIEGAHRNIGLGHEFLQHVERCRIILHVIASDDPDYKTSFHTIRNELAFYNPAFLEKDYAICITKTDLVSETKEMQEFFMNMGFKAFTMSNTKEQALKVVEDLLLWNKLGCELKNEEN